MTVAFALVVVPGPDLPDLLSRPRVQGDQEGIGRAPIDAVAVNRDAPVVGVSLGCPDVFRKSPPVNPSNLARDGVEGQDAATALGHVHQPVRDDRRRHPPAVVLDRIGPDRAQVFDVRPVDPLQRTEAVDVIGAPVAQPVPVLGVEQAGVGDRSPVVLDRLAGTGTSERQGGANGPDEGGPGRVNSHNGRNLAEVNYRLKSLARTVSRHTAWPAAYPEDQAH
jgi:hypothetical protein